MLDKMLSTTLKTAVAETTILTVNSIAINSIKCFETRDTSKKLTLNCGSWKRFATPHLRVRSPMIGQYTLDSSVNSNRDTGTDILGSTLVMCILCVNTLLKVISHYDLSVLSMSLRGFQ